MDKKLKALRQRLHDLKAAGRKALADATALDAKAERSADEDAALAALHAQLDRLDADVQAAAAELEAEEQRIARETRFAPLAPGGTMADLPRRAALAIASPEPDPRATGGFHHMADFAQAVHRACRPGAAPMDERLAAMFGGSGIGAAPTNFHQESGSTYAEGYMVPPAFREQIWELVFAEPDLLSMVDMEPTQSNSVGLLKDETTPWGGSGVVARWRNEGSQMTPSKLATKETTMRLHELYAFVLCTDELLEDAPRLADRLTRKASQAISWKASDAIVYGDGVGKPLGYFMAPCLVSVAKEGSQTADTVVAANVAKMYARMPASSISRAVWMINPDVFPQLPLMTIGNQPAWTPPNQGMKEAPGGFLLGRPVLLSEHCKTVGDKGDIQFIDPMGYYAARKAAGMRFDASIHLYFDYGIQAFRWTFRLAGQPYLSSAIAPANGSSTKSHFVVLDDRA